MKKMTKYAEIEKIQLYYIGWYVYLCRLNVVYHSPYSSNYTGFYLKIGKDIYGKGVMTFGYNALKSLEWLYMV